MTTVLAVIGVVLGCALATGGALIIATGAGGTQGRVIGAVTILAAVAIGWVSVSKGVVEPREAYEAKCRDAGGIVVATTKYDRRCIDSAFIDLGEPS